MLFEILGIIAPVFVCAFIGYTWVRSGQSYPSEFVSKLVFNIAAPCLVVSSISQVDLSIAALSQMALASVMALALLLGFSFFVIKTLGHDVRLFSVSLTFANVGNMGLPLCLFAFGQEGLALAVAYFMVISIAHFSLGTALASGERISWGHFFKNPILFSIAIATFLVVSDYSLPHWINNSDLDWPTHHTVNVNYTRRVACQYSGEAMGIGFVVRNPAFRFGWGGCCYCDLGARFKRRGQAGGYFTKFDANCGV